MFDEIISRKNTYSTQWDYIEDRFGQGSENLIPYTISDMDFRTSPEIIQKLKQQVDHGIFGYSRWNNQDYLNAITNWYKEMHDTEIEKDWILYVPSVIYAVAKIIELSNLADKGIMMCSVRYDGFDKITSNYERLEVPLVDQKNGKYSLDFAVLEDFMQQGSKIFLIANPQNPTGKAWNDDELSRIKKLAKQYDVLVISDEIHMDIARKKTTSILKSDVSDNVLVISSPSKTFNTASLGGAYAIIPNQIIRDKLMNKIKNQDSLSSATIMGIISTIAGYNESKKWLKSLNEYITSNMVYFKEQIDGYKGVKVNIPDASYLMWIDISNTNYTSDEFVEVLKTKGNVAVMKGTVYGDDNKIRINLACPKAKVEYLVNAIHSSL